MKEWIRQKLFYFFLDMAVRLGNSDELLGINPVPTLDVLPLVIKEVEKASKLDGTSGEYKRQLVYGRIIKKYPKVPHWCIGLAIELAIKKRR